MPAFCAAFGSFHPKSSVMYFVRVLTTVRVLPLFLTLALIRSSTLTVSTFGVRSYSDQRYWSIQTSGSGHASRASELTAGLPAFCTGSAGLTAANGAGGVSRSDKGEGRDKAAVPLPVSEPPEPAAALPAFCPASGVLTAAIAAGTAAGRGIGGGSDKAALPLAISATTEPDASLASFCSASGVLNDAVATGTAAGRGLGGGSDKAALPRAVSSASTPSAPTD